jgi:type I restriction enzyme M protein
MFEKTSRNIDDILRKESGCTTELDYTEQSSWLLFLKYLDDLEQDKETEAQLEGRPYQFMLKRSSAGRVGPRPGGGTGRSTSTGR